MIIVPIDRQVRSTHNYLIVSTQLIPPTLGIEADAQRELVIRRHKNVRVGGVLHMYVFLIMVIEPSMTPPKDMCKRLHPHKSTLLV